eukprot:7435950-Prorocentrum_lima.AAC.1
MGGLANMELPGKFEGLGVEKYVCLSSWEARKRRRRRAAPGCKTQSQEAYMRFLNSTLFPLKHAGVSWHITANWEQDEETLERFDT